MIKLFLFYISSCFHFFFNLKMLMFVNRIMTLLRSYWYRKEFATIGSDVLLGKSFNLLGGDCIKIGDHVSFGRNCVLTAWKSYRGKILTPNIVIRSNCHFGEYNHITSTNEIYIDTGLLTGRWVTISDNSHGETNLESLKTTPIERPIYSKGPVRIGKNVWLGDKVTILPGVTIGDGVVVGANSVITKSIPPYSVVVGNPAHIINRQ